MNLANELIMARNLINNLAFLLFKLSQINHRFTCQNRLALQDNAILASNLIFHLRKSRTLISKRSFFLFERRAAFFILRECIFFARERKLDSLKLRLRLSSTNFSLRLLRLKLLCGIFKLCALLRGLRYEHIEFFCTFFLCVDLRFLLG